MSKTEREILIEQCLQDSYLERTGEMLDESWWDDMKANIAGTVQGAKQGLKNFKKKTKNTIQRGKNAVARGAGYVSNVGKGIGNAAATLHSAGMNQQPTSVPFQTKELRDMDANVDKSESVPAQFAKNYSKIISYSKGISENIDKLIQIISQVMPDGSFEKFPLADEIKEAKDTFENLVEWDLENDYFALKKF